MDLFTSMLTPNQQLKTILDDYKQMFECEQNGKGRFRVITGDKNHYGNCILFIIPNVSSAGFMNAEYEENLITTLKDYHIENYIIAYAQPNKTNSPSRKLIKQSRPLMHKIIEIVSPKMIIAFDDSSAELFMNQKPNIIEDHGKIITTHYDIPVILTYNMDYYIKRTGYEDAKYKRNIFFEDWVFINQQYKEYINVNI